jgi:hypothetical protein
MVRRKRTQLLHVMLPFPQELKKANCGLPIRDDLHHVGKTPISPNKFGRVIGPRPVNSLTQVGNEFVVTGLGRCFLHNHQVPELRAIAFAMTSPGRISDGRWS